MNANIYGCDRQRAYGIVWKALKKGILVKPEFCSTPHCNNSEHIEAHHKDYNKPLDVTWLCQKCHSEESVYAKQELINV